MKPQRFLFSSLALEPEAPQPLFRQLEHQLRQAIGSGLLQPGERLPSSRQLATQLGVGRNTVISVYEQLTVEGYLCTSRGSGTRVSEELSAAFANNSGNASKEVDASKLLAERLQHLQPLQAIIPSRVGATAQPFFPYIPATAEFPNDLWAQLSARRLRRSGAGNSQQLHALGFAPLREAIAAYLGVSKNMAVSAEQVVITAGVQQAFDLLAKLLINPGDEVAMEQPGYTPASMVFAMLGAAVKRIPLDEEGIKVDALAATSPKAKLVYLTPSHQFPTGVTLSLARRAELLQWARERQVLLIEDDYNGEYRYRGRPLASLYSMADDANVIYLGSFSKLLFPSLRLGYMVVPKALVEPLSSLRWVLDRHSPFLEQAVLADFINEGHFARHLRRMRGLYAERQQNLVDVAERYWADYMDVASLDGGLHLVGKLKGSLKRAAAIRSILTEAEEKGLELVAFSQFGGAKHQFILGYAPYSPKQIQNAGRALQKIFRKTEALV